MLLGADARAEERRENAQDDIADVGDVDAGRTRVPDELEQHALEQERDHQTRDQADRSAEDLAGREAFDRVFDRLELNLEDRLRDGSQEQARQRPEDRRDDRERDRPRLIGDVQRNQVQIRLAAEQKARHGEDDHEQSAQQGAGHRHGANVTKAPQTSFATKRPRRVKRTCVGVTSSIPAARISSSTGR